MFLKIHDNILCSSQTFFKKSTKKSAKQLKKIRNSGKSKFFSRYMLRTQNNELKAI